MDEARITLTIKPKYVERFVYWLVILVLAILLIMSYLKDGPSETSTTSQTEEPETTENTVPEPEQPEIVETCVDGIRNQDETDVDCGGSCGSCAAGKRCGTADDCSADYCVSGVCTNDNPQQLSGDLKVTLTNVEYDKSPSSTVKVTGVNYEIENGLEDDLNGLLMKVFIKNKAGTRCLNQQASGTCDDSYAEVLLPGIQSGRKTIDGADFSDSHYTTRMGRYLILDNGYDPEDSRDDDFSVFIYLYDTSGNLIDGKTVSTFRTINPT